MRVVWFGLGWFGLVLRGGGGYGGRVGGEEMDMRYKEKPC